MCMDKGKEGEGRGQARGEVVSQSSAVVQGSFAKQLYVMRGRGRVGQGLARKGLEVRSAVRTGTAQLRRWPRG